jgi:hypothetical protein
MSEPNEVTLREHLEKLIQVEADMRRQIALDLERRLDGMNELRRQIESERGTFVAKEWFEKAHVLLEAKFENGQSLLEGRVRSLESFRDNSQGRSVMLFAIIAAVPTALALWALIRK